MHDVVDNFFNPEANDTSVYRVPWHKYGWMQKAKMWVEGALRRYCGEDVKKIAPVWSRFTTQVIRFETDTKAFYFKASRPAVKEAAFTKWVTTLFPRSVPVVVDINKELNAFIMEDFGPTHDEGHAASVEEASRVYQFFGRMQLEAIKHIENSENLAKVPELKLLKPKFIASRLDMLLDDPEIQVLLDNDELHVMRAQLPIWKEICDRLEDSGIPCSLIHGDLHSTNFAVCKGRRDEYMIFDWYRGSISHPFIQLHQLQYVKGVTEEHIESYLSLWRGYVSSIDKLKRIATLSNIVGHLHHCVYSLEIAKSSETAKQGVIKSIHWDDRANMFKGMVHRLKIVVPFAKTFESFINEPAENE